MDSAESMLVDAAMGGDAERVKQIISDNPTVNINSGSMYLSSRMTPLHLASANGCVAVIKLLLSHPDIKVNAEDCMLQTPFMTACQWGRADCARVLLDDLRVDIYEPNRSGDTPLSTILHWGHVGVLKTWITSGRHLSMKTCLQAIQHISRPEISELLAQYFKDPSGTRHRLNISLLGKEKMASDLYALVIFVADSILETRNEKTPVTRFFAMAIQLPLELQILLCSLFAESAKDSIPLCASEKAFLALAKRWCE